MGEACREAHQVRVSQSLHVSVLKEIFPWEELPFSSFGRMERFFFGSRIFVIWQYSRQIFVARQENSSFGC